MVNNLVCFNFLNLVCLSLPVTLEFTSQPDLSPTIRSRRGNHPTGQDPPAGDLRPELAQDDRPAQGAQVSEC